MKVSTSNMMLLLPVAESTRVRPSLSPTRRSVNAEPRTRTWSPAAVAGSHPGDGYDGVVAKVPVTPATRLLDAHGVAYTPRLYRYEEHGGTRVSARELGVDEHAVVKTLVMQDETKRPLVVLMHGDREVSTKALARQIGRKAIDICAPDIATRHSGYLVGGTSPFGTRKAMPVFMERTILDLPLIHINGGHRGFLVSLDPRDVVRLLDPTVVEVGYRK
jgi:Cys-tRNA(Pro) deacylase